jgi:hypothetical protein
MDYGAPWSISRNEPYAKWAPKAPGGLSAVLDAGFWHWLDSTLALSGLFSLR